MKSSCSGKNKVIMDFTEAHIYSILETRIRNVYTDLKCLSITKVKAGWHVEFEYGEPKINLNAVRHNYE